MREANGAPVPRVDGRWQAEDLKPDIVAVTTRGDLSADLVLQCCAARNIAVFRFNSEDYPQRVTFQLDPQDPESSCLLLSSGETVAIGRARSVWLRRPQWPVISPAVVDPLDRNLAVQEAVGAAGGLWRLLSHLCVSEPDALQAARWKLPQLRRAAELGFAVPRSLVTSDRKAALTFLEQGPCVIKAIHEAHAQTGTSFLTGFTEPIEPNQLEGIDIAPVFLQRRVDKIADYRVTVIGSRVFAARLLTPAGAPVDVRATQPQECAIQTVELDPVLEAACLRFVRAAGLRFGCFDFGEDAQGTTWFLECNPNGQWGWIESATGQPITEAIVDLLLRPNGA